jgi:hypothetical protein
MIPNEMREKAYFEIDMLLSQLESGPVKEAIVYQTTKRPINPPAHAHIMGKILKEYKLIEIKSSQDLIAGMEKSITMNGIRALTVGGIREYMIDTDPAFVIHDNYPMVVSVVMKNGLYLSKHLINSSIEYAELMEHYENEEVHYTERTSHRLNGQIFMQTGSPALAYPNSSPPQITNHYHNHIQGSVDNIIQDSIKDNSGPVNLNVNRVTPDGKKRSWIERWSWIAVIVGTIVAIIMGIYEIYFKK